jgi:hypothetical protein
MFIPGGRPVSSAIVTLCAAAAIVVAAILVVRCTPSKDAATIAALSLVPYLLLSAYVLPWYAAWVLPALALRPAELPARIAAAAGIVTMLLYWPRGAFPYPPPLGRVLTPVSHVLVPIGAVAATVALLWWTSKAHISTQNTSEDSS